MPPERPTSWPAQQGNDNYLSSADLSRAAVEFTDPVRPSKSRFSGIYTFRSRYVSASTASPSAVSEQSSDGRPKSTTSKGPYGLANLHSPPTSTEVTAHIVFVHGLGGGSEHTWTCGDVFWPRDLLPNLDAFRNAAVFSFEYNSDFTRSSVLDINDFSKTLLARILNDPLILDTQCPILLVGHSMGGLVIKNAFVIAKKSPSYAALAVRIRGIFFIATPQQGSDLAVTLSRVFRLSSGSKPFLKDLHRNSEAVQNINVEFGTRSTDLLLYSFYETNKLSISGFRKILIVPKQDAILNYPNEQSQLLNGDHRSICKFSAADDTNFIAIWQTVAACLKVLQTTPEDVSAASHKQTPKIDELSLILGVKEAPIEDLQRIKTERLPGTCEWLLRGSAIKEWQTSESARILWFRGPPASGKSFMTGFAIEHFVSIGNSVCYYFFAHGDKQKSSFEGFLLSMVWQMAGIHPAVLDRLLDICRHDQAIGKTEYPVLVRKLWEHAILDCSLEDPVFWIIDAIEECSLADELTRFLARVQEIWKSSVNILITTRNPATDYSIPHEYIMQTDSRIEDVQADIEKYLNVKMHGVPGSPLSDRNAMIDRIVQRSNGCFLWAILVLRRLSKIPGSQARLLALEDIQPEMDELYARIVLSISEREKDLSKFILTWITTSIRVLNVEELRYALEHCFYASDRVGSVEDLVATTCHDLVYVDDKRRVRMRHDSARSFLLRKDTNSTDDHELTIREGDAHKMLAMACLDYLNGSEIKGKRRKQKKGFSSQERSDFALYACQAVLEHINNASAADEDILSALATFLRTNVLRWIEHLAREKDLDTVLKMAQALKSFTRRRSKMNLVMVDDVFVLDNWATDLVKLVSKFGRQLLGHPESILYLIPPFCPSRSAPYIQFAKTPAMAFSVDGLSATRWDDLLCTIHLSLGDAVISSTAGTNVPRERLLSIATTQKYFCVGTSIGRIAIFNEKTCNQECFLDHGADLHRRESGVLQLQFADTRPLLASVSKRLVRIWNTSIWKQQLLVRVPADCMAITFVDDDCGLLLALVNNELWELDLISQKLKSSIKWTDKLDGQLAAYLRGSCSCRAAFDPDLDFLAVTYRNHDILVWNYIHNSYQFYNPDAGGLFEPVAKSNLSVDAVAFSRLPNMSMLAAAYTTGDVVIFDAVSGKIKARTSRVYAAKLVSSPDGKTLAAAGRDGTIGLYDFETLHQLSRIAPVDGAVSALVFSHDGTRLLDIRAGGRACRLWDPAALFRLDIGYDSVASLSIYSNDSTVRLESEDAKPLTQITALACEGTGDVLFVGKEDASVSVYDSATGRVAAKLFSHMASIKLLFYDASLNILISTDTAGIVMAHEVMCFSSNSAATRKAWDSELLFAHHPAGLSIRQVLCRKAKKDILICTNEQASLFRLSSSGDANSCWSHQPLAVAKITDDKTNHSSYCWVQHPSDPNLLVFVGSSKLQVYTWRDLQRVSPPDGIPTWGQDVLPPELRLANASVFFNGQILGVVAFSRTEAKSLLCLPTAKLSGESPRLHGSTDILESTSLSMVINCLHVVGEWRERLIFLHPDGWICSVRAATVLRVASESSDGLDNAEVLHHFAPPIDWLRTNCELLVSVTRRGDVVFAVRGEVVVVHRGLDKSFDLRA